MLLSGVRNSRLLPILAFLLSTLTLSYGQIKIFNGAQEAILTNASTACLAAFNTSLACDSAIQYITFDLSYLNWQIANLTSLCTNDCYSSLLELENAVSESCGNYSIDFNSVELNTTEMIDLIEWKYNMSCLADSSTGSFCLIEEQGWNVSALNASGEATWPVYTNVTYPDYESSSGNDFQYLMTTEEYGLKGKDYFVPSLDQPTDNGNHGAPEYLDYDEFPLEIQCSYCFLEQIKLGINSRWGEVYDTVMEQNWANIQLNCNITDELKPVNNATGEYQNPGELVWDTISCAQEIVASNYTTCDNLALVNNVASASIMSLNEVLCSALGNGTYCADESCQTFQIENSTSARAFLASYAAVANITLTQFSTWNPYVNIYNIQSGEVVCVGAPGGNYIPASTTIAVASPTVFTTTASAPTITPSGTIANCGSYYIVQSGDYCNIIAQANSLTLGQLYAMNPSLDSCCSNLLLGEAYCVAAIQNSTVTSLSTTSSCSYYTISTSGTSTSWSSTSSQIASISTTTKTISTILSNTATLTATVAAPTQTRSGSTVSCYEWYVVQSGDGCWAIEQDFDITIDELILWNTDLDSDCDGLWANYAYCVDGPAISS